MCTWWDLFALKGLAMTSDLWEKPQVAPQPRTAPHKMLEMQNQCTSLKRSFCGLYHTFIFLLYCPSLSFISSLCFLCAVCSGGFMKGESSLLIHIQLVCLLSQCPGDAELLQVLRPGDMAVYAVLAAAAPGPGLHPHVLLHLLFLTCIQPLLPADLLILLPSLRLASLHLQRPRRDRHATEVMTDLWLSSSKVSWRFSRPHKVDLLVLSCTCIFYLTADYFLMI